MSSTLIFLVSRGQRALKLRTKMESVRVQQRRRPMKEDQVRMREMKRHMTPHWPKPDLQKGWTGEEIAAHQSKPTRGMRGTVTGQQGRGIPAVSRAAVGGAPMWSSLPCTCYPGRKERSSGGAAAACCPTSTLRVKFQQSRRRWVLMRENVKIKSVINHQNGPRSAI